MKNLIIFFTIISLMIPSVVSAHPGRTDKNGCHVCRTNCSEWGLSDSEYHCHATKVKTETKHYAKRSAK
ncbi:MAG: YHYH domain-containing protein [Patescibacteria group bacterium]